MDINILSAEQCIQILEWKIGDKKDIPKEWQTDKYGIQAIRMAIDMLKRDVPQNVMEECDFGPCGNAYFCPHCGRIVTHVYNNRCEGCGQKLIIPIDYDDEE